MCGIVAEHGGSDPEPLERMLERLAHRGPDERGAVQVNGSWLGHRRLSIVDVGGGRQPLCTRDGSAYLVGNGEVYNHEEVRAGLEDRELLTTSDNEVALHLIDERGTEGLSELSAFVEPFPPGCAWTPEEGMVRFASAVPAAPGDLEPVTDHEELLTGTRDTLVRAVEQQMMGDVNVGVFLSGGLDSSLVAAIASRIAHSRGRRLQTFAVGTEGSPDLVAARQVAEHLDCEHVEVIYTAAEALESLPSVVRAIESFDPGLVRSAVPNYMLARTTRQHVKVVLTGEGADELFAGYDYMREFSEPEALHAELERTVRSLHNLNLQRCDRVTMAHSVEARVPFLDRNVIEWALRIPPAEKQGAPEKRLLRESFEGWLPDELLWRTKAEFGDGSGARDALSRAVEDTVPDAEFAAERDAVEPALRTKEELAYYRVWREHLQGISAERALSRFARA